MNEDDQNILRRQVDIAFLERIVSLEICFKNVENSLNKEVSDLKQKVDHQKESLGFLLENNRQILEKQQKSQPILESLDSLAKASIVMKWVVVSAMGILGAFATVMSVIDLLRKSK